MWHAGVRSQSEGISFRNPEITRFKSPRMSLKASILPERGVLRVGGPEAREFLQNLITNNVDLVDGSHAIYAGLLTPQGKFLFDFFISADGPESFSIQRALHAKYSHKGEDLLHEK